MTANRNRVRIIGGQWRSRLIKFPPAAQLRPTPDRVRETLFNWLGQRLDGWSCLDLFAGSGALGFEALSRGASRVVMVDSDRAIVAALRESARELDAAGAEVVQRDALKFLLAQRAMQALRARLKPGARAYVESPAPLQLAPPWRALREDRAGAVRYALYELTP